MSTSTIRFNNANRTFYQAAKKRVDDYFKINNISRYGDYRMVLDTPASYVYHTIRGNLKDAFIESGSGFEQTYAGKFPKFRIDYILHSKEFKSKQYHHLSETVTDHYPIISYIQL